MTDSIFSKIKYPVRVTNQMSEYLIKDSRNMTWASTSNERLAIYLAECINNKKPKES